MTKRSNSLSLVDGLLIAPILAIAGAALILGGMNLYQAVTGKRLSKKPSTRSDEVMRRQSAIAGSVLIVAAGLLIAISVPILAGA